MLRGKVGEESPKPAGKTLAFIVKNDQNGRNLPDNK